MTLRRTPFELMRLALGAEYRHCIYDLEVVELKKINLEIEIKDLELGEEKTKTPEQITRQYLGIALDLYQTQPNERGQTRGLPVSDQRKIYKILDELAKEGKEIELEDDWFSFLYKAFNAVKWIGGTKIVVRVADKLEEAKGIKEIEKK